MDTFSKQEKMEIELTVNGQIVRRTVPTTLRLLDFLRDDLHLTGAKEVCAEGECGACTVFLDGRTVNSCLIFAVEADGAEITTIEGLAENGVQGELKKAFVKHHSVQCGYCIPGMVLSGLQVLEENDHPSVEEAAEGIAGNICRCTGYHKILEAIVETGRSES